MSWADKQLKKHKLRKQIKEIMDSPEFQKERQKELDKHTAEAMNCFLLISVDCKMSVDHEDPGDGTVFYGCTMFGCEYPKYAKKVKKEILKYMKERKKDNE